MERSSKKRGEMGEEAAVRHLKKNGFRILERNHGEWNSGGPMRGEIDIVAEKNGIVSFVEVKTTFGSGTVFFPEDRVGWTKRHKIERVAEIWLLRNKKSLEIPYQIDVIAIAINEEKESVNIRYFPNI